MVFGYFSSRCDELKRFMIRILAKSADNIVVHKSYKPFERKISRISLDQIWID